MDPTTAGDAMRYRMQLKELPGKLVLSIDPVQASNSRAQETFLWCCAGVILGGWLISIPLSAKIALWPLWIASMTAVVALLVPHPVCNSAAFDLGAQTVTLERRVRKKTTREVVSFADVLSIGLLGLANPGDIDYQAAHGSMRHDVVVRLRAGGEFTVASEIAAKNHVETLLDTICRKTGITRRDEMPSQGEKRKA